MATQRPRKRQISVVVYPGVSALELVGTISALDGLGLKTGFRTVTVGERREPVDANTPMKLVPERTFEEVSHPFGLLIPGGGMDTIRAMADEKLLRYVRSVAEGAQLVASVGTGSLILAAAGLLEGRQATTHPAYRGILENLGATYVGRRRTQDGKFVTSGGTSGGVDMGLNLVADNKNEHTARQVQLWIEYDPQPPFGTIERREDDDALVSLLTRHRAEWQRVLAQRPDLLEAVQRAMTPAADAATQQ